MNLREGLQRMGGRSQQDRSWEQGSAEGPGMRQEETVVLGSHEKGLLSGRAEVSKGWVWPCTGGRARTHHSQSLRRF